MGGGEQKPIVSVVMATFNRANLLPFSTASVRWQSFTDWELIIVDDGSTDDTAEVVRKLAAAEPRIRYVARAKPAGEQSAANNAGFDAARGRIIAYLNHDDLWFPDHLQGALDHMERTGADLSFSLPMTIAYEDGTQRFHTVNEEMRYDPTHQVPATYWVFRRELVEKYGGWRAALDVWGYPSQDRLWHWWRNGAKLYGRPELTCLHFPSGNRPAVYSRRDDSEIAKWFARMRDEPDLREKLLIQMVLTLGRHDNKLGRSLYRTASQWARSEWCAFLIRRGVEPQTVQHMFRFRGKGGWFAPLRAYRHQPPLDKVVQ